MTKRKNEWHRLYSIVRSQRREGGDAFHHLILLSLDIREGKEKRLPRASKLAIKLATQRWHDCPTFS